MNSKQADKMIFQLERIALSFERLVEIAKGNQQPVIITVSDGKLNKKSVEQIRSVLPDWIFGGETNA
jgi:hypothetical protein